MQTNFNSNHMKKIIITYGLIAGLIVTAFMVYGTVALANDPNFKPSMVLGYAGMIIAFAFVFVGTKNYRDKQNGGTLTFGQAFKIGFFIALIASTIYVGVWLIEYYCFYPDFMDKYIEFAIKEAKSSGISATELQSKTEDMNTMRELYKNPIMVILLSFAEILPLGIFAALISAIIFKRNPVVN